MKSGILIQNAITSFYSSSIECLDSWEMFEEFLDSWAFDYTHKPEDSGSLESSFRLKEKRVEFIQDGLPVLMAQPNYGSAFLWSYSIRYYPLILLEIAIVYMSKEVTNKERLCIEVSPGIATNLNGAM